MNNNIEQQIITAEPKAKPLYDFEFIAHALGLIPINNGCAALAPGAITHLEIERSGRAIIGVHGGEKFELEPEQMAELEATIKRRSEEAGLIQKEGIKNQMLSQAEAAGSPEVKAARKEQFRDEILMQNEVATELQNGVQPGRIVKVPTGRKFQQ